MSELLIQKIQDLQDAVMELQMQRLGELTGSLPPMTTRLGKFMRTVFLSHNLNSPVGLRRAMARIAEDEDVDAVLLQGMRIKRDPVTRELGRALEALSYARLLAGE